MGSTFLNGQRPASNMLSRLGGAPASTSSSTPAGNGLFSGTSTSRSFQTHAERNGVYDRTTLSQRNHMTDTMNLMDHKDPQIRADAISRGKELLKQHGAGDWEG